MGFTSANEAIMHPIHRFRIVSSEGETLIREIRAPSHSRAEELVLQKFSNARSVALLDSREVSLDEKVAEAASEIERRIRKLEEEHSRQKQRKNRGLVFAILSVAAILLLFQAGSISALAICVLAYGLYEYFSGHQGAKKAKRDMDWEAEQLNVDFDRLESGAQGSRGHPRA